MKSILILIISLAFTYAVKAGEMVETYPAPKGISASENFKISVSQNGANYESFVYYSSPLNNDQETAEKKRHEVVNGINTNPDLLDFYFKGEKQDLDIEQSCSYTCFSFNGKIKISITYKEKVSEFKILPSSAGIEGEANGNIITFTLTNPEKLGIVVNNNYLNPLFLFADAPEQAIPAKDKAGTLVIKANSNMDKVKEEAKNASVLWFEPGIHHIGVAFPVYSNQTVYMAGGSYLLGTLHGRMVANVTIRGRGILSGDSISRSEVLALKREVGFKKRVVERMRYHAINMLSEQNDSSWNAFADYPGQGCDNLTIEGIIIADARQFFIRATGVPMQIYNVKMVGSWPFNTDGISTIGQNNTTVYDCFFHCNDDAIYVAPNNCHIHHCRFWQGQNGNVFQFGWGSAPYPQGGAYIHDCDILHCGHVSQANNRMIIGSRKGGRGDIGHVHFKNINIEGPVWSIFRFETNGSGNLGSLHDILVENLTVTGPVIHKSTIQSSVGIKEGETSTSWVKNITFKNVVVNGEKISKDDFILGDFQVENIVFE